MHTDTRVFPWRAASITNPPYYRVVFSRNTRTPPKRGEAIKKGGTEGFELTRLSHSKPQTATKGLLWISRNQFCWSSENLVNTHPKTDFTLYFAWGLCAQSTAQVWLAVCDFKKLKELSRVKLLVYTSSAQEEFIYCEIWVKERCFWLLKLQLYGVMFLGLSHCSFSLPQRSTICKCVLQQK